MATSLSSEATVPSTPPASDNAIFSDQPTRASSPPSSPPGFPWERQDAEKPRTSPQRPTRSAFSMLGKRKALEPVNDNARPTKRTAIASTKPTPATLTQMQISAGQEVQKKCKQCGMEYVASSAEDRKLHDKYHKQNTEGYDVGKDFVQKARDYTVFAVPDRPEDMVCAVDCFDKPARKRRAQAVLEIVQRELGAVAIPENDVWDLKEAASDVTLEPRYRAYMFVRASKCVGFLLTEMISEARCVQQSKDANAQMATAPKGTTASQILKARKQAAEEAARAAASQPIRLSEKAYPALLGICRIWTSPTQRKQNIATSLLDAAVAHHNQRANRSDGSEKTVSSGQSLPSLLHETHEVLPKETKPLLRLIDKGDVAFSQPTEAGARLARKWFGKLYGWKVYVD